MDPIDRSKGMKFSFRKPPELGGAAQHKERPIWEVHADGSFKGYIIGISKGRWQPFRRDEVRWRGSSWVVPKIPRKPFETRERAARGLVNGDFGSFVGRFGLR